MPRFEMLVYSGGYNVDISDNGSRFEFKLSPPLSIPPEATSASVSVPSSTIWWTVPNIKSGENDKFYVRGKNKFDVVTDFVIIIPQGLYSLPELEQALLTELENSDAKILPYPLVNMHEDSATGRALIRLNYTDVVVTFNADSPWKVLGFKPYAPYNVLDASDNDINNLGPFVADFNPVDTFLIHTSLVNQGLGINNIHSSIVSQVQINVPPGSQIITESLRPPELEANHLIGAKVSRIVMWLTDANNIAVHTGGEHWGARLAILYE